ncbi:hypothetical protein [Sphingomonas sp.]|uniref:hypothetical protein n=1 Tax=Sphingomonas sp. TaxID=28214 RepID=UPI0039C9945F
MLFALSLLALAAPMPDGQRVAQHRGDQWHVFTQRREGRMLPLREIESRVVPSMRGADYIGFDFDGGTGIYTLKFLRNGAVIWVEVDGRSGQILGRTGR